ncbi:MAG: M48 family metalloprotease [Alphaproteobacteria bacterium]|nr:M48 family metalloprotease [Alphaproteobacteria bacterium]
MAITRRHFCGLTACSLVAGLGTGCTVNPATGSRDLILVNPDEEKQIGLREHPKILAQFGGVYKDSAAAGYVASIGGKLAATTETPSLGFTFTLLDSPIVNAFALPGGYVYISRGLMALAGNEAELAGVLGHEIGHVVARHSAQRQSQSMLAQLGVGLLGAVTGRESSQLAGTVAGLYLRSYSRDQELEADMLGIRYLRRTGYDINAMASFLARLRANSQLEAQIAGRSPNEVDSYDITATHPRTIERVQRAAALSGGKQNGRRDRNSYLKALDGMIFGDGPEQGYTLGRRFAHPKLRFEFSVPQGFKLQNRPDRIAAASKQAKAAIIFTAAPKPYRGTMSAYLSGVWGRGAALNDLEAIKINGFGAATAWVRARDGRTDYRLIAIRFDSKHIFRFVFAAAPAAMQKLAPAFQRTTYSFKRLSPAQAAVLQPKRLKIVAVRATDTVGRLSGRMAFEDFRQERFVTLNGLGDKRPLASLKRVKLVVQNG